MTTPELHIISTGRQSIKKFVSIASNIQHYVDYFHLREKQLSARDLYEASIALMESGIPSEKIIINDRVDVAWALKTAGVQLAYHSLKTAIVNQAFPGIRIGCSIHSADEAKMASDYGADYAIFGHIFETKSKAGLPPKGLESLHEVTVSTELPIIAIGGIKPKHVLSVMEAGAKGIAVMSGVLEAEDPLKSVKAYMEQMK